MSFYHVVAILPGDGRKTINNRSESDVLTEYIVPFLESGTVSTNWGKSTKRRQALELRVYRTDRPYAKKLGVTFEEFISRKKNVFDKLAERVTARSGPTTRVFVVMPLQGEKFGDQDEQRIHKEFDDRFTAIEDILDTLDCYAIRIDKEVPLEGVVDRIKEEIRRAAFILADLTDERPSCYFEAGFAEALGIPVVYLASKQSVVHPGMSTHIHFDIHKNINWFSNHEELKDRISRVFEKNRNKLLEPRYEQSVVASVP